jgi:hypothetical protein
MRYKITGLLLICMAAVTVQPVSAQANARESFSVNFGPEIIFPEASFRNSHKTGIAFNVKAEYTFGKHASATLNTGLASFAGKEIVNSAAVTGKNATLTAIPLRAGGRYYLGSFYFLAETGVVFLSNYTRSANAVLTAGLGDKIKIGYNKLDISLRQERWFHSNTQFNMAVLRVAYEVLWRK